MPLIRDKNCLPIFSWNDKRKTIKARVQGSLRIDLDMLVARGAKRLAAGGYHSLLLCLPRALRLTSGNAMPQLHD